MSNSLSSEFRRPGPNLEPEPKSLTAGRAVEFLGEFDPPEQLAGALNISPDLINERVWA